MHAISLFFCLCFVYIAVIDAQQATCLSCHKPKCGWTGIKPGCICEYNTTFCDCTITACVGVYNAEIGCAQLYSYSHDKCLEHYIDCRKECNSPILENSSPMAFSPRILTNNKNLKEIQSLSSDHTARIFQSTNTPDSKLGLKWWYIILAAVGAVSLSIGILWLCAKSVAASKVQEMAVSCNQEIPALCTLSTDHVGVQPESDSQHSLIIVKQHYTMEGSQCYAEI